jgi:hypothetical protein
MNDRDGLRNPASLDPAGAGLQVQGMPRVYHASTQDRHRRVIARSHWARAQFTAYRTLGKHHSSKRHLRLAFCRALLPGFRFRFAGGSSRLSVGQ